VTAYTQYPLPHRPGEALGDGSSTQVLGNIPCVCIVKSECNVEAVVELVHAAGPINVRSASPTTTTDSRGRLGRVFCTDTAASALTDPVIWVDMDIGLRLPYGFDVLSWSSPQIALCHSGFNARPYSWGYGRAELRRSVLICQARVSDCLFGLIESGAWLYRTDGVFDQSNRTLVGLEQVPSAVYDHGWKRLLRGQYVVEGIANWSERLRLETCFGPHGRIPCGEYHTIRLSEWDIVSHREAKHHLATRFVRPSSRKLTWGCEQAEASASWSYKRSHRFRHQTRREGRAFMTTWHVVDRWLQRRDSAEAGQLLRRACTRCGQRVWSGVG
jgi:hypothetical protein